MKKVIRLTESDLTRIVKRVIMEQDFDYNSIEKMTSPNMIYDTIKNAKGTFNDDEAVAEAAFIATVEQDLSDAATAPVKLKLFQVDELLMTQPQGICLDGFAPTQFSEHPDASLLKFETIEACTEVSQPTEEIQLYSHLLRSNCPVTGQPDWGTVFIRYKGKKPCYHSLLAYIISFRQHNGFHEQCVEQIYADIWQNLKPEQLMVYAAYTRRGGLDINPCRVSDLAWLPSPIRLARQ